eukprot:CAMPEP_0198466996 /NCGR_PEP_ID=MMETSP1456-20131121/4373_1 /TAXON_ID=1461544 ORGANISM="Unidentified sp., Strain RCC1871" /NCGR_SAMPLE_ID=MMETSP1456 /ASSEMBLY_ACC=CAM_ASM_001119 /LENGTH=351 /DNA_ID=CAMNT_0044192977 /DNA_START=222 /DNA_END=1273 /DNA_ORIENTATION=+
MACASTSGSSSSTTESCVLAVLEGHRDRVWHVCWANAGDTIATCGGDRAIKLWRKTTQGDRKYQCVETLEKTHTKTIRRCGFSRCDSMLASVSFDATTCVWERPRGEQQHELLVTLEGHESEIKDLCWSQDGELLATCGRDKSIWIWLKEIDDQFECLDVLQGHTQDVKSVLFVPGTRALLSASYDNTVRVWNEHDDEWVCTQTLDGAYQGHESTVWGLCCDAEGSRVLSCDAEGMILLWRVVRGDTEIALELVSRNMVPTKAALYSVDWSPSGLIATGMADNSISLLQAEKAEGSPEDPGASRQVLKLVKEIRGAHDGDVNCVRFNPKDPGVLASAGDDEVVKVWDVGAL